MKNNSAEKKKIKILYVVGPLATGILTYLQNLCARLSDRAEITIVYGVWPETPDSEEGLFDDSVRLIRLESLTREINPAKDIKAGREIKKIARTLKPDVVHMHSSKAGALGRLFLDRKQFRMFYTPHGYAFLMNVSPLKKAVYRAVEKMLAGRATTIACSESEYLIAKELNPDCECIDNGIDFPQSPCASKDTEERPRIYTSGRVSAQKNPALFNEIAMLLPEYEFVWIGAGPEESSLTAPNITVTGWVERDKAIEIASRCDIFLLPSLWEGLSVSLLEAMAAGRLCIVSSIPGNLNAIEDGVNGAVCSSAREYADAVKSYPSLAPLGLQAAETVKKRFSMEGMAEKYYSVYCGYVSAYLRNCDEGPACYYRFGQYVPDLESAGLKIKINNAYSRKQYRNNFDISSSVLRKLYQGWLLAVTVFNRSRQLNYDIKHHPRCVVVQRETVPRTMPGFLYKKLARMEKIIWDFDDDIRLRNECSLKEFELLSGKSSGIVITNSYLMNILPPESRERAIFMPTTQKPPELSDAKEKNGRFRVLWLGSFSSLHNLDLVGKLPEGAELVVVCNRPYPGAENVKWTREEAERQLLAADAGIMPLKNEQYNFGKGGFKLIQYMSAGIPVIASPVGYNCEIVKEGFGFLTDDFYSAVSELMNDPGKCASMGRNARLEYDANFSYGNNLNKWTEMLL